MKKLLFMSLCFAGLLSCNSDDNKAEECTCNAARYKVEGREGYFYVRNMPIDCETGQPLKDSGTPGAVYDGCERWD